MYNQSAVQGDPVAQYNLGVLYQNGFGVPVDYVEAIEWYEKALEVIDDPELEQKTALFKMMGESEPDFGEDYPEDIEA